MTSRTALAFIFCIAGAGVAARQAGWQANPDLVRQLSVKQPDVNYEEARVGSAALPDVLKTSGGATVGTRQAWTGRRAEIVELFREPVDGRSPGKPEHLRFGVIEKDTGAMNGTATLQRVAIVSTHAGREHRFELTLFLPFRSRGSVPVFLLLNNRPATNTDPTRHEKSGFWPAERIVERGYGIAAIQVGDLAP